MEKLMLKGVTHAGEFELTPGFITLGRNPTNDFRIPDSTVSSFHCELIVSEDLHVVVRDLNSTNGTFVDDQPAQESTIKPGQTLRLGSARLDLLSEPLSEPVRIAIPKLQAEPVPASVTLPDGSLACLNHSDTRASLRCVKCLKVFCPECVHILKLAHGQTRSFCPACSGRCETLPGATPADLPAAKRKPSLIGRLTQTIRIRFK
jgi:pSer/pThr/pTyr-binding forkhead associated (FHA) protein